MTLSLFQEERPEYDRAPMSFWREQEPNGLKAVGSFSGCGGSSMGLKMAGWEILAAIEFIPAAADTYEANFPGTRVFRDDIRKITAEQILTAIGLKPGELDLFEGSPPCASFSSAGMRERGWGEEKTYSETKQRTDDLFEEWVRILGGLRPRAFIAENVPGMLTGSALEEYAHAVTKSLGALGYRVSAKVLNAANFGVPQERKRLIFVGFREDVAARWEWPAVTTPIAHSLQQALDSVPADDPDHAPFVEASSMEGKAVGRTWEWLKGLRAKDDCARCGKPLSEHEDQLKEVGAVKKMKGVEGAKRMVSVRTCADGEKAVEVKDYFMLTLPNPEKPCPTLTSTGKETGAASVVHPSEKRKFTPAEAKAICGFPPDFILTGSREQRYERMGRAVPPPLYWALGEQLRHVLKSADNWRCSCGRDGERYDGGDACEACVLESFAEHG